MDNINHEEMKTKLNSMKTQAASVAPIKTKYEKVSSEKNTIVAQLDVLLKESNFQTYP